MWTYVQSNGNLARNGVLVGTGYSGHGPGINDPTMENLPNVGPIPRGAWTIGPFFADPIEGPVVACLVPDPATATFGRSGFRIHGDTAYDVETGQKLASEGCIVLPRAIREQIAASGDTELEVV